MLTYILTWHQVMPAFIDFLLAFGASEYPRDFHYSGFRSELDLDDSSNRLNLRSLDRSGRELRLCHVLRSVERLSPSGNSTRRWPWSLRPTVTYHSFDAESNRSVWLIVKANDLIKKRVRATCKEQDLYRMDTGDGVNNTFESTLRTHLVLCALAGENWRWYINYIEERVQALTRGALTEPVDQTSLLMERLPHAQTELQEKRRLATNTKDRTESGLSFEHLQEVHFIEEKANEGLLVLRANFAVIQDLHAFYTEVNDALIANPECIKPSLSAIQTFQRHLDVTSKELTMQEARFQTVLQLLADRRALVRDLH
jgi:hypothetical protein